MSVGVTKEGKTGYQVPGDRWPLRVRADHSRFLFTCFNRFKTTGSVHSFNVRENSFPFLLYHVYLSDFRFPICGVEAPSTLVSSIGVSTCHFGVAGVVGETIFTGDRDTRARDGVVLGRMDRHERGGHMRAIIGETMGGSSRGGMAGVFR